jgi:poly-gamma-glutamate synthesis protein (capsule biosynthesis protein)
MSDSSSESSEIVIVGDIILRRKNPKRAFDHVYDRLQKADLLIGNQEGAFSNKGEPAKFYPWANFLYSPPEMVEGLNHVGFDVLSLANNQTMNYGPESLLDSIELLREYDIATVGAGVDRAEAERPVTKNVNGVDVAILAYEATMFDWGGTQAGERKPGLSQINISPFFPDPNVSQIDLERMNETISTAAENHDVVLVYHHFGVAGTQQLASYQKALARQAVDHGADAVLGAHSHTLQPIEVYNSSPIIYSLNNFVFDRPDTWSLDLMASETIIASLTIDENGVKRAIVEPALWDSGPRNKPKLLSQDDKTYSKIVEELKSLSERVDTQLELDEEGLVIPT